MTEQRRYHRMKIHLPVSFETEDPKTFVSSSSIDISPTGLAVRLTDPIRKGQYVTLTINVSDTKIVKVEAQVMWVREKDRNGDREYEAGLKIVDKMDRDEIEFIRFVAQKMIEHFKTQG